MGTSALTAGTQPALVLGFSPVGEPDARLVAAVARGGGLGVLDLGTGDARARRALELAAEWTPGAFGVRVGPGCRLSPADLPAAVDTVVLARGAEWSGLTGYRVLAEVTDLAQARQAAGCDGVLARGHEAGPGASELSSFVLLQQLVEHHAGPVWLGGGLGPRTAAAAVAAGASGVVLDRQFTLLSEVDTSGTPDELLAPMFAERFGQVDRAVRAVREAILAVPGTAPASLGPDSPLAQVTGAELPIAQGPMTRVSDRAAFAASVAEEGALPFVALALSNAEQTRTLLAETRDAIPDRPWGAGILGFAPEELRAAQLAAIRAVKPSCVIVAGGRPAQAAALEAEGIQAFLHVPSPGLLRQFLDAGARKFVFEGAECGGHVGPAASFPLWEAQIDVLIEHLDAHPGDELHVYFAGGVHDARSAAAVAVAAAPLAARGAGVGVLMGSAYLFTQEAVDDGAVLPAFQRQVLAAERTELLETAPGHATRCVHSPFVSEFRELRETLRARGLPDREVWEELEQANVGRLRIASKGIRRDGAELLSVDEPGQVEAGLYMAGQVAVLRAEVTTVGALHRAVTEGAREFHEQRAADLRTRFGIAEPSGTEPPAPLDVAIVGMSAMFPQAPDLATFWANVLGGADAVTEVPAHRWSPEIYHGEGDGRTPSKWGGFLPAVPFDPLAYGIPPSSLAAIEPVQLLALAAADRALADAGLTDGGFDRTRTSVVFGAEAGSDLSNATVLRTVLPSYLGQIPDELDRQLPRITEDSFPGMLANVIAGRIANRLDLGGANYTVDAACASSLAAVDVACKELVNGTSDVVLCGGADLHNGINDYLMFSSVQALSPTGRCHTFDSSADGIALGEGVACVVLKRLADAERDGDRIYAVVKGVGSASDGRSLGLTAPRPEGQRAALERAYRNARLSPASVGLVEAHGTGTVVGDRTELTTLSSVFTEAGAVPGSCAIGSVKSQIGHTKCAAGLAGVIKTALALHTGTLPPTLHVREPNPGWDREASPFAFRGAARPWAVPPEDRVAGVSAFGFGGTNFHVVLTAGPAGAAPRHAADEWPAELFLFGDNRVDWLLDLVRSGPARLRDLAATAARRAARRGGPVQAAVVASTVQELAELLPRLAAGEHDPGAGLFQAGEVAAGKLAMVFPGQGSQRPGMLADLFVAFPELQHYLRLPGAPADEIFPPAAFGSEAAHEQRLRDTRVAQPALGVTGLAVHHLLSRLGVRPDLLAGHSYGELVALCAAGSFDAATLLHLSGARADAILDAAGEDPGTMAAVSATVEQVRAALGDLREVVIANHNAPRQVVLSGPVAPVDRACAVLREAGLSVKRIPVACAFHSPVLHGAGARFAEVLAAADVRTPELPVFANRTAGVYGDAVRDELAAQIEAPVGFAAEIEAMYAAGARVFCEAGPGKVLSRLIEAILGDRPHTTVGCDGGLRGFLGALATLAVSGVAVDAGWLFRGRDAADVGKGLPKRPKWTVDGQAVRTADGDYLAGGLVPARRIEALTTAGGQGTPMSEREELIREFLRTSRDQVAAQRDVLLTYLGATAGTVPAAPPVVAAPEPARLASPEPVWSSPSPEPAADFVPAAPQPAGDVLGTVVSVIADRTGYPAEMIEPGLDLEADLSVDSIKRTEIAGELAQRLPLPAGADLEDLARLRTTSAIAEWFSAADAPSGDQAATTTGGAEPGQGAAAFAAPAVSAGVDDVASRAVAGSPGGGSAEGGTAVAGTDAVAGSPAGSAGAADAFAGSVPDGSAGTGIDAAPSGIAPRRFVLEPVPLPDGEIRSGDQVLAGQSVELVGGTAALTETLGAALARSGAALEPGTADTIVHLEPLSGTDATLPDLIPGLREELARGPRRLFVLTPPGSDAFAGLRGLFRSLAREYPGVDLRAIELDGPADLVVRELAAPGAAVVQATATARSELQLTAAPFGALAATGAGPAGDGAAEAAALGLGPDSVLLFVGGGRGITARAARAFAATGCAIELVGRTPLPSVQPEPAVAGAADLPALRRVLAGQGVGGPAEIERAARLVLAQREVSATLDALRAKASSVRYHTADVREDDALHHIVKEIHAEHGRLDGVVYAAGVLDDRLFAEKDPESFRRVYGTKVDGARALLAALDTLPQQPGFVVLFGSIAGALGNRGQTDYAAANDALETLGAAWAARSGQRALTVHWGPWAPDGTHGGMVSPELARSYAGRGIELIDPDEGTAALLRELAWGDPRLTAVVHTASGW
ncbi:type I polyketide synthase [Amycolatopsis ultiminotia]|uniref:Type I polyketide synthase n=1 Tax=Amycolatopsis ultiminotia TaxID=543629 RepID=A0ABP6V1D8_9PSEU